MSNNDINFMRRAIQLALEGEATVSPNPMVGAVIVKDNRIIGEGFHKQKGGPHAEIVAIDSSKESIEGATLYCSLEPCCHTKKTTPPCTDRIIKEKIARVVVASIDPNPMVAGNGILKLKEAGIEVVSGVLEAEADEMNKVFFKNMKESLPYIHCKVAITLDGRMATNSGDSKWISSEYARKEVHRLREKYDAVMIGVNTLRADNPQLNARVNDEVIKENKKIIVGNLKSDDLGLKILKAKDDRVFNLYTKETVWENSLKFEGSFKSALGDLYKKGVTSILVEGGPILMSSLLDEELMDEGTFYVSPKLIGNGPTVYKNESKNLMKESLGLNGKWRINQANEAIYEVRR